MAVTYKDVGVDISRKTESLAQVKSIISDCHNSQVLTGIGHFGGLFSANFQAMDTPVLVSSTASVGTKVEVATAVGDFSTIGGDIVNHCVNDILCCGARPLFFLDYIGTSKLETDQFKQIIQGLSDACKAQDCPLVSGETAEMPGIYHDGCVDLVGTIVGVVDRKKIIDGHHIQEGDLLLGLSSHGLHTNGYTLARKVFLSDYSVEDKFDGLELPIGRELLRVHRSYYKWVSPLLEKTEITGLAHITGGGIIDNVSRLLPDGLSVDVDWESWERPALFRTLKELGPVPEEDMRHTFNLGIGFVLIVRKEGCETIQSLLAEAGEKPELIGQIVAS